MREPLYLERKAYLTAIQDALASVEGARVALARARQGSRPWPGVRAGRPRPARAPARVLARDGVLARPRVWCGGRRGA